MGAISGIIAMTTASSLEDECPDRVCAADKEDEVDASTAAAHVSTVGFAVGGAGVVVALVAYLVSNSSEAATSLHIRPASGGEGLAIRGSF